MQNDDRSNEPTSAAMSPEPTHRPHATESEFLEGQANAARAAIGETLTNMRTTLKDAGDIKAWARQYPWPSVGAAAAIGFLAAGVLAPSRKSNGRPDTLMERVLADEEISKRLKELSSADAGSRWPMLSSMFSGLLQNFGGTLQSTLVATIAALAQSAAEHRRAEPEPETETESAPGEPI